MRPALELLIAQGGELTFQEVLEGLQEELALSEEDLRKRLPSGRETIFANRLDWALTYLKTFGHVDSPLPVSYTHLTLPTTWSRC